MNKAPKLRFKEFSGGLGHHKFKDLVLLQRGSSPRPISMYVTSSDDGVNWIKIGDVSKDSTVIYETKEKITPEGAKKSRFVEVGDLILSNSMSFGRPYIMAIDGCIHDGWFVLKNYSKNFNRDYLCHLLTSPAIQKQYKRLAAGGVVDNISSELVNSVEINLPSKEEQEKIASLFSLIDDKISLQGEKVEALKDYKKGMMQNIFSRELRFKDDDGRDYPEWEEKKLGELDILLVRGPFGSSLTKGIMVPKGDNTYKVYEQKHAIQKDCNIGTYYVNQEKYDELKRFAVKPNDYIMSCSGTIGELYKIPNCAELGIINQALLKITVGNDLDENYFLYVFRYNLNNLETKGSGIKNITSVKFLRDEFEMPTPCISEQKKIAKLLINIDKKLEKEQDKLDYLNEYKKGLLQQLFV
ncbi:MAG: restriction endonuclease subunit S [Paraclostridium sp.]